MSNVLVFDKAMCCNTGICGPQVDPVLPRFAADLDWLSKQGHSVSRFNLAHDAAQFAANATVQKMLAEEGTECLPLILVDGRVLSRNEYPARENLALWTNTPLKSKSALPVSNGDCCGGSGCC